MQRSLNFITAALFAIATLLSFWKDGEIGVKTLAGVTICGVMIWLGVRVPRKGTSDS